MQETQETWVQSLGWEDPLEKETAICSRIIIIIFLLQYSCWENSMDRGAWRAIVHGVTKESDMTERTHTHAQKEHAIMCCTLLSRSVVSDLCDPVDCSLPAPSVHGILQARTLEGVAMPSSRASSPPGDPTQVSCIAGRFLIA